MTTTAHLPFLDGRAHLTIGVNTADLANLAGEVHILEDAGAEMVHIDVMDGVFCPMTTVGPPFIKAIRTPLLKDAHLMIVEPLEKVADYVAAGPDIITIQVESTRHPHRVLQVLGKAENANDPTRGIIRGVALNPGTPVTAIEPLLDELEYVLILAVNPGWGGQKFIESTERRLAEAKALIERSGRPIMLGADGGVTRENIARVAAMGPNLIVTGSAVFDAKAPAENARYMLDQVRGITART
ncbi:MAG: ribulose-phosphate 3-epimerase [Candidatus Limnocylindrales bacterium]|jgi:ribulose-phosphate 3-epimerase